MLLQQGVEYFNPDDAARKILSANAGITQEKANSAAWLEGKRLLERAIAERRQYAFETTLGGNTITTLLEEALASAIEVRIWYVGLRSPEIHIARVGSRVIKGGHHIPEGTIRERYEKSRVNLIRLLPGLTELRVYDNSDEADPDTGGVPEPKLLLHLDRGRVVACYELSLIPDWAKPILAEAMRGR